MEEAKRLPPRFTPPAGDRRERVRVTVPMFDCETFFDFSPAPGRSADTLVVYHHGLCEIPHNFLPRFLFLHKELRRRADRIDMKGLFHSSFIEVTRKLLPHRNTFTRSLVASSAIAKAIAERCADRYRHLILCGVSMGGIITLIEALEEPRYQLYVPLIAGPDISDVMLYSRFSRTVHSGFRKQEARAPWLSDFDITRYLVDSEGPPIRPLLARSDQLFRHDVQLACYERIPRARATSFEGGHLTGVNPFVMSRHLHRAIDIHCWSRPAVAAPAATSVS